MNGYTLSGMDKNRKMAGLYTDMQAGYCFACLWYAMDRGWGRNMFRFLGWFFRISVMPVGYMVQVAVKGIGFRHAGQAVSGTGDRIAAGKGTGG